MGIYLTRPKGNTNKNTEITLYEKNMITVN